MKRLNKPLRANYHTHTARCHHADGTEEEYVRAAIDSGFGVLGFSDHGPWPYADGFVSGVRMLPEELPGYVDTVRELGRVYADRIRILCGLECEYYPTMLPWLREQKEKLGLDYLILGNHFAEPESAGRYFGNARDADSVADYVRATVQGMETGLFAYVAHPDVALQMMTVWSAPLADAMRELCRAAKALDIPLEYNLLGRIYSRHPSRQGRLCYPNAPFWELAAAEGCTAIVGLDAHQTAHMTQAQEYDEACAYVEALGMPCIRELPL